MANVGAVISSIRNIMRQDRGISGDAQRLEQLGWMLFLKIIDDKDQELEITKDDYVSVIPQKFQWRTWATDSEGITGDELLEFIDSNAQDNKGLFATLRELTSITNPKRAAIVKEVFEGSNNYMKSGYEMRKVINKLNEIDFNNSEDKHIFGNIYESILQELRDAGNKGEYYTPRAVTQFMTQMTNPKLGEKVLDPAAGTGGFLTAAIDHVRANYVHTVEDEHQLQKSIIGWELKPVAYVLGLTNLILHEMDVPDYHYMDSLKKEYNSIGTKDRVDVILANPPFGASIADGVETNFPATYRCKESADLFVILMLQLLKSNGRCAIVLPDGSMTGDGVKSRIREKLLTDCNLHTIIRMPTSTFFPAAVATNLLFFEKGSPTKEIWYYEHKLPEGQKSYSKTKPIQFEEFNPIIDWWNNREENEVAWKVNIENLKDWNLDIQNPFREEVLLDNSESCFKAYYSRVKSINNKLSDLLSQINFSDNSILQELISNHINLFRHLDILNKLKRSIVDVAIKGDLTNDWRNDNTAITDGYELKQKMQYEKSQLIKDKKIKKEKPLPPISTSEIPYQLPKTWSWSILDEVSLFKNGKAHEQFVDSNGEYILINSKFVSTDGAVKKYTSELMMPMFKEEIAIVMSDVPNGRALSRCFLVEEDNKYSLNQRIGGIIGLKGMYPKYLIAVLDRNPHYLSFNDGKKQTNLKKDQILSCPIPLPPLEEQIAIVDKVESLIDIINALELEINQIEQYEKNLMQVVLKEAFEGKQEVVEV